MRFESFRTVVLAAAVSAAALIQGASATPTYHNIYTFCASGSCGSNEGTHPEGALVMDSSSGNLYGTTQTGGAYGFGTVYELSPDGTGGWTYRTVYSFCQDTTNCPDGGQPVAALIIDTSGNLYGTTSYYGHTGTGYGGTVFRITHPTRPSPTFKVLYTFCSLASCADGNHATTGLSYAGAASGAYNGTSPLYGTTVGGGSHGAGIVYELDPPAGHGAWNETVLYNLGASSVDVALPSSGVLVDASGDLYGTAGTGAFGSGGVYQLAPSGGGYSESVVYNFCSNPVSGCPDGKSPAANLVLDSTGNKFF
ncbi:MAG TPA: choice-of-anchor tandem repeat GloVer-containing protein, partial [Rhizomicrobium sp.]|nr:choice-of-anchor tandem repeat GloVer-containing protein [Rhizomicrobium sp.]